MKSKSNILNSIAIPKEYSLFFVDFTVSKVKYQKQNNQLQVFLTCQKPLPYEAFKWLLDTLENQFNIKVQLFITNQEATIELKQVHAYISYYFNEIAQLPFHNFLNGNQQTISIILDQPTQQALYEPHLKDCEAFLKSVGINVKIALKPYNQHNGHKVVTDFPSNQQPILTKEKPVYRRKKASKISYVAIAACEALMEDVAIKGYVIELSQRLVNGDENMMQTFILADGVDAISVKRYIKNNKVSEVIADGLFVSAIGRVMLDKYRNELVFLADDIIIEEQPVMTDDAIEKRIEWHAHTKMSEMDGVSDVEALIRRAFEYKHHGLAICDHSSVQAFPKAEEIVRKLKKQHPDHPFTMIYGVELNMVDDFPLIMSNPQNQTLDKTTYVVVDIETTGLSNRFDEIIEFAGAQVYHGQVIKRYSTLIKPTIAIPDFISEKTNITDKDVENAPVLAEVIQDIVEFCNLGVLVAHNAPFDIGFLISAASKHGYSLECVSVLDTLELSRVLLPERKGYKLGKVAKGFSIAYDEDIAHRASYDVEVTKEVLDHLLALAKAKGYETQDDLAKAFHEDSFKNMMKTHVNVIAKNQAGLKSLFELVSIAHTDTLAFYKKANSKKVEDEFVAEPRIKRKEINLRRENLLVSAGCFNNEIFEIAANRSLEELYHAMQFYDVIEIQDPAQYQPLLDQQVILDKKRLEIILSDIITTAKKANKIVIASGDVHYVDKKDKIFRDVMIFASGIGGIRHPFYLYDQQKRQNFSAPDQHFKSTNEMLTAFSFLDQQLQHELVIENPNKLLKQISTVEVIKNQLFTPKIPHADQQLTDLIHQKAKAKYGYPYPKEISKRIDKELDSILSNGFGVIYYIAHLLVKRSLDDGYLVGSRGSVGSSFVAYLAEITEVNPLAPHYCCHHCHHLEFVDDPLIGSGFDLVDKNCPSCNQEMIVDGQDIPFETFLGFEGDKVPDIDLNFSTEYQEKAHAYTKELFGEEKVFRAGTIGTIAKKSAYGYAKGYGEEKQLPLDTKDAVWSWLASGVEGVKRTSGQHPGGIIVIPENMDVTDFTPIQFPANNPDSQWKTTHFEFADIHDNLLKLDILGHLDPSAMRLLHQLTGVDPTTIKMNDPTVMKIFSDISYLGVDPSKSDEKTGAVGLPEFGTTFVRDILKMTKPTTFSDLVRISGLSHGTDVWLNNARDLIVSGKKLNHVIGCRDDIMVTLIQKGLQPKQAFDIMEAVRKGKGLSQEWIDLMKSFDIEDWYIDSCQKIKYMFPKAHAVAYVIMAVRVAWYKVYHPLAFYISYFTLRANGFDVDTMLASTSKIKAKLDDINRRLKDNQDKLSVSNKEKEIYNTLEIVLEMKNRGFKISNLDINRSDATHFIYDPNDEKAILPPFIILDGLGENVAQSIIMARAERPFISKEDLMSRTQLNFNQIKKLDQLKVIDHLQEENQCSLF